MNISPYLLRRLRTLSEEERERLRDALRALDLSDKYVQEYMDIQDTNATRH